MNLAENEGYGHQNPLLQITLFNLAAKTILIIIPVIHCTVSNQFANAEKALVKTYNSLWADTMFSSL